MKLTHILMSAALAATGLVAGVAQANPTYFADPCTPYPGTGQPGQCSVDLQYFGGPLMTGSNSVYYIWYGDFWKNNGATQILNDFAHDLSGSEYMNIAHWYADGQGQRIQNTLNFGGSVFDTNYLGNNLSDNDVATLVNDATKSGQLPVDPNAVYFVFTDPTMRQQQDHFACGWHSSMGNIKYSWVTSNTGCDFLGGVSGNQYADSLTETMSHELMEALTDPDVGDNNLGWYDYHHGDFNNSTGEIGDSCVSSNFAASMNGHHYDVQSIFVNDTSYALGGYCASGSPIGQDVPEPAALALSGLGLAALGLSRRRRRA